MARIFVVGSGVVGTATGRGFVEAGHDVTFVDVSAARLTHLRELGLDAQPAVDLRGEPESFVFLTLPTPNVGARYDMTAFTAGLESLGVALRSAEAVHTVVVRSTVTPGTTEGLVGPVLDRVSGLAQGVGYLLASNPEFLRAASAAEDFRWPWMTVVGARSKRVQERLAGLLAPFGGELRVFDNPVTAELVKCAHNIFNATKISFWNEMWMVARQLGVEADEVAGTVALSAEASFNPSYGIRGGTPYGGVCLPKDTRAFLGFAADTGLDMPLLRSVIQVNDGLAGALAALDGNPPRPGVRVAAPDPVEPATVVPVPVVEPATVVVPVPVPVPVAAGVPVAGVPVPVPVGVVVPSGDVPTEALALSIGDVPTVGAPIAGPPADVPTQAVPAAESPAR